MSGNGENRYSWFIPKWGGIWFLNIKYGFHCSFSFFLDDHSDSGNSLLWTVLWKILSGMCVGFCQMLMKNYFYLINMVYDINWFSDVKPTLCVSRINLPWLWYRILFVCCWSWFVDVLLRVFTSMFLINISVFIQPNLE